jgi:hypothetical protein
MSDVFFFLFGVIFALVCEMVLDLFKKGIEQ